MTIIASSDLITSSFTNVSGALDNLATVDPLTILVGKTLKKIETTNENQVSNKRFVEVVDTFYPYDPAYKKVARHICNAVKVAFALLATLTIILPLASYAIKYANRSKLLGVQKYTHENTLLIDAAKKGDFKTVNKLKNRKDILDDSIKEALFEAAYFGKLEVVKALKDDPRIKDRKICEALCVAAAHGHLEIIEALKDDKRISVEAINAALIVAAGGGYIEIVNILRDDPDIFEGSINEALVAAAEKIPSKDSKAHARLSDKQNYLEVVKVLVEDSQCFLVEDLNTAFAEFVHKGHLEIVNILKDEERVSSLNIELAFIKAVNTKNLEIINALKGDETISDDVMNAAFNASTGFQFFEIVDALKDDERITDENINKALFQAAVSGPLELVIALKDDERVSPEGINQAFRIAEESKREDVVNALKADYEQVLEQTLADERRRSLRSSSKK